MRANAEIMRVDLDRQISSLRTGTAGEAQRKAERQERRAAAGIEALQVRLQGAIATPLLHSATSCHLLSPSQ